MFCLGGVVTPPRLDPGPRYNAIFSWRGGASRPRDILFFFFDCLIPLIDFYVSKWVRGSKIVHTYWDTRIGESKKFIHAMLESKNVAHLLGITRMCRLGLYITTCFHYPVCAHKLHTYAYRTHVYIYIYVCPKGNAPEGH